MGIANWIEVSQEEVKEGNRRVMLALSPTPQASPCRKTSFFTDPTQVKHAVFVAFHYPPEASSSGVLRTLKYTRYLPECGWRTTVITPRVDAYSIVDPALESQIPPSTKVIRTPYLNTKRHLSVRGIHLSLMSLPDTWVGWMPWGIAAGRRLMAEDPFDLVYSTSPHATAHLIARRLAKNSSRPWVTDFRDPWVEDPPEPGAPTGVVYTTVNKWLERKVIEDCDAVATSTTHLRELLRARYPRQPSSKFCSILNGYDEADFAELPPARIADSDHMVLLHAGGINAAFRDPHPLLSALRGCADAGDLDLSRVKVRFLGGGPFAQSAQLREAIDTLGLRDVVELLPRVAYAQSLEELTAADMLVLLQASPDTVGLVPAKLYEYLRAGKPVLAIVPPGATSEVLDATHGGWSIPPGDSAALQQCLATTYRQWRDGTLRNVRADPVALRRYDRRSLTGELAQLFDRLAATSGSR